MVRGESERGGVEGAGGAASEPERVLASEPEGLRTTRYYNNLRQLWDTRYTPFNDEVKELLRLVKAEAGGTWTSLAEVTGLKSRVLRRIFKGEAKTISFRTMDIIFCRSNHLMRLLELEWLTVEELLERGIWRPPFAKTLDQVMQPQVVLTDDTDVAGIDSDTALGQSNVNTSPTDHRV